MVIAPIMQNQLDKEMGREMKAGVTWVSKVIKGPMLPPP